MEKSPEGPEIKQNARMAACDRRQQIIEVAVRLFSKKGFQGTTTKEIAQAAGVNEAIIFRHFVTKSELYAAIIDWKACSEDLSALELAISDAERVGDYRSLLEGVAFRMFEINDQDEHTLRLMLYSGLEGHELAELFFRNHIVRIFEALASFIKRRINAGTFRRVDPMTAVRAFIGMVHYHAMTTRMFPHQTRELLNISNRQAAERFTDIFLASMLNLDYEKQRSRRKSGEPR